MTLVSIIIPVYQVSEYIEQCLRSVMNQTYINLECIIINDATKDDSIEKCERLINDFKGSISFHIIHQSRLLNNRKLKLAIKSNVDVL